MVGLTKILQKILSDSSGKSTISHLLILFFPSQPLVPPTPHRIVLISTIVELYGQKQLLLYVINVPFLDPKGVRVGG